MIIGISGKIGSGKDTVGNIIRFLIQYNRIVKEGYTTDQILHQEYIDWNYQNDLQYEEDWEIKKFADKLKDIVCLLIGCTKEQLEDQNFKNSKLNSDWDNSYGIDTVRDLLQVLGTDCGRDTIHPDLWVIALFSDYKPSNFPSSFPPPSTDREWDISCGFPNWIITDMRFSNELEAIKKRNGITIRVNKGISVRDEKTGKIVGTIPNYLSTITIGEEINLNHSSETALDNTEFDYIIDNNDTIEKLIEKVKKILIKEELITS